MRKSLFFLSLLFVVVLLFTSCKKTKTYAEMQKEEENLISKLLTDSFNVIPFNGDSLYTRANKHIMKMDNGVYIAIISKGNTNLMAIKNVTTVTYRFSGYRNLFTNIIDGNISELYPLKFEFGQQSSQKLRNNSLVSTCDGIQKPLDFLGDGAIVKLIIPSSAGFLDDANSTISGALYPIYFDYLRYTFAK